MVSKILRNLAVVSTLVCSQIAHAFPLSLVSNSSYDLSGTGTGIGEAFADTGGLFLAFYQSPHGNPTAQAGDFYVYLDLGGSMSTGNLSGNNLSTLNVNTVSNLVSVVQYDGTSWNQVSGATGSASSSLLYNDVTVNSNKDIFALINGTGTGNNGQLTLDLSFGGNTAHISEDIKASFMPFDQATQGYYDPAINAFSNNGILDFALAGFNGGIHGWFESYVRVQFGGTTYYLQGDTHANYSDIPEPASMGLLTAGLLGVLTRRKKNILA